MTTTIRDWEREGQKAFRRGRDLEDCPYDKATTPYYSWRDGWILEAEKIRDQN